MSIIKTITGRVARGIRGSVPSGTVLGRSDTGDGPVQFLTIQSLLAQAVSQVLPANIQTLLNGLGTTQGDIIYRNATVWTVLGPGAAGQVLTTGGASANPSWATLATIQALLDSIGNTRGSILYRGASGWAILTPGTAGYVLTAAGTGADPSWAAGASSSGRMLPLVNGDLPGPGVITDPSGQCIGVAL